MEIKNVIFDVGGVLAGPKSGHWFITPNFWDIVKKDKIDEEKLIILLQKYIYLQTQEPKTEEEEHSMFFNYYYHVLNEIRYKESLTQTCNELANDCVYNDDKFIFYDDVNNTLVKLSNKYNLYIISNGWPSSIRVLKNKKINIYFKDVIISSMYGTTKEENLFDVFFEINKDIDPKQSIYIDDRQHILKKANSYGFKTLLMDRKNKIIQSEFVTINDMYEIEDTISKINKETI